MSSLRNGWQAEHLEHFQRLWQRPAEHSCLPGIVLRSYFSHKSCWKLSNVPDIDTVEHIEYVVRHLDTQDLGNN